MYADLMEEETSEAGGDDGVTDQEVPVYPLSLDPIESGKVRANVELLSRVFVKNGGGSKSHVKGHDRGEGGDEVEITGEQFALLYSLREIGPLYSSHGCYASCLSPIVRLLQCIAKRSTGFEKKEKRIRQFSFVYTGIYLQRFSNPQLVGWPTLTTQPSALSGSPSRSPFRRNDPH